MLHWSGWLSSFPSRSFFSYRSVLYGLVNCQTCSSEFTLRIWMEWTRLEVPVHRPLLQQFQQQWVQKKQSDSFNNATWMRAFSEMLCSLSIHCCCFFYHMKTHFNCFTGYLLFPLLTSPLLSNPITHHKLSLSTAKPTMVPTWVSIRKIRINDFIYDNLLISGISYLNVFHVYFLLFLIIFIMN